MNDPDKSGRNTLAFILPLILFLVISNFYPDFTELMDEDAYSTPEATTRQYILLVGLNVVLTGIVLIYFRKVYLQHFPFRYSSLSILVGAIGVVVWVGLCELHIERSVFSAVGLDSLASVRPAFNPYALIADDPLRITFLLLRFTLLALMVPIVEELFLRGWLVRWIEDPNWEPIALTSLSWKSLLVPSLYGVVTHPSEAIAAFVWFGMVTWLMRRTGNLWDCVIAHAVTNFLLGIYLVRFEAWQYW